MVYIASDNRYDTMPFRRSGKSGLKLPIVETIKNPGLSSNHSSYMPSAKSALEMSS